MRDAMSDPNLMGWMDEYVCAKADLAAITNALPACPRCGGSGDDPAGYDFINERWPDADLRQPCHDCKGDGKLVVFRALAKLAELENERTQITVALPVVRCATCKGDGTRFAGPNGVATHLIPCPDCTNGKARMDVFRALAIARAVMAYETTTGAKLSSVSMAYFAGEGYAIDLLRAVKP